MKRWGIWCTPPAGHPTARAGWLRDEGGSEHVTYDTKEAADKSNGIEISGDGWTYETRAYDPTAVPSFDLHELPGGHFRLEVTRRMLSGATHVDHYVFSTWLELEATLRVSARAERAARGGGETTILRYWREASQAMTVLPEWLE